MLQGEKLEIYNRINQTIYKLNKYNFTYKIKDFLTGCFVVWDLEGKVYQYIAETEIILGRKEKGINNLIKILRKEL